MNTMHPEKTIISTERLKLPRLEMDDLENLMGIFSDPLAMQYYPSTKSRKDAEQWIMYVQETVAQHGLGMMVVELKNSTEFVGQCGYWVQQVKGRQEIEIGYLMLREHWNKGYATEAAIACREFAFSNLGLNKVISLIRPVNKPSTRGSEKNGMTIESKIDFKGYEHLIYIVRK